MTEKNNTSNTSDDENNCTSDSDDDAHCLVQEHEVENNLILKGAAVAMLQLNNNTAPSFGNPACGNDDWVPKNHRVLYNELCKDGKMVYKQMFEHSKTRGNSKGLSVPTDISQHAQIWQRPDFELNYNKPNDFLVLTRKPFPMYQNNEDWETAIIDNCHKWGEIEVEIEVKAKVHNDAEGKETWKDTVKKVKLSELYQKFASTLKEVLSSTIRSKLTFFFTEKAKASGMQFRGRNVTTFKEVYKSWTEEVITMEKCQQLFEILYGCFEREDIVRRIQWETMYEHGLFFSDENNLINRTKSGEVVTDSIYQLVKTKIRDSYRSRFTVGKVPHGVTVNITVYKKSDNKKLKRKRGEFVPDKHVKGWGEPKLLEYNKEVSLWVCCVFSNFTVFLTHLFAFFL